MTRICEKFIENLSSKDNMSEEMKAHLAGCPSCQQNLSALTELKQMRRPISGKEAASIAGIMKTIKTAATATPTATAATSTTSSGIKPLIMALSVGAAIAISVFIYDSSASKHNDPARPAAISYEQPVITIKTTENEQTPVEKVTDTEEKATISSTTSEEIGSVASETITVNDQPPVEDDTQVDSQQHPQAHVVSPDQEEVVNSE